MARPTSNTDWMEAVTPDTAENTEPSAGKKSNGWGSAEKPPFQFMNWLFWNINKWFKFIDGMLSGEHNDDGTHGVMTTTEHLTATKTSSAGAGVQVRITGDTISRGAMRGDGDITIGPGGVSNHDIRVGRTGVEEYTISNFAGGDLSGGVKIEGSLDITGKLTGEPVAFSVHKGGANQSMTHNVTTKVTWPTEDFDTNSDFASDRFTPTVSGKYLITIHLAWDTGNSNDLIAVNLAKNGTEVRQSSARTPTTNEADSSLTAIVDANGTGDYFEVTALNFSQTSASKNILGGSALSWFHGHLIALSST